eukprot:1142195-Pelagomonas_calceolata.AAC.1
MRVKASPIRNDQRGKRFHMGASSQRRAQGYQQSARIGHFRTHMPRTSTCSGYQQSAVSTRVSAASSQHVRVSNQQPVHGFFQQSAASTWMSAVTLQEVPQKHPATDHL